MTKTEEKVRKLEWMYRPLVIALLIAFVTGLFTYVPRLLDILNNKTFKSAEIRIKTEAFIENVPTQEELRILKGHATDPGVHMPKKAKDSVYVRRTENDELFKNFAIDQYNMKRNLDEIERLIKEQKKEQINNFKVLEYRLERIEKKQN